MRNWAGSYGIVGGAGDRRLRKMSFLLKVWSPMGTPLVSPSGHHVFVYMGFCLSLTRVLVSPGIHTVSYPSAYIRSSSFFRFSAIFSSASS